jgi:hypothetical protein
VIICRVDWFIESQPTINFVVSQNGSTTSISMSGRNQEIAMAYGHDDCCDYSVPVF